jgi:hypothetical protein
MPTPVLAFDLLFGPLVYRWLRGLAPGRVG